MESKPSFWLFLKTILTLDIDKYKLQIYEKKSKVLTLYDVNLFYYKGLFRWFKVCTLIMIFTTNLQIKRMLRPMGLMPNFVFEFQILEIIIVIAIFILLIYKNIYCRLEYPVIEQKINASKNEAIPEGARTRKWVTIVSVIGIFLYLALNSYTVTYIRSLNDKDLNNPENIEMLVSRDMNNIIDVRGEDIIVKGGTSSIYAEDEYILLELRVSTTPLPVRAYLNGEEFKATIRKYDEDPSRYTRFLILFWEKYLFYRRVEINLPDEKLAGENTLKIVCGEIEKTYQIQIVSKMDW